MGLFLAGRSAFRMVERPRGSRKLAVMPGIHETGNDAGLESLWGVDITRHVEDVDRGLRHVAPLRRWLR
jgi:hypothetical protein